jgi:hypothetical protein
MATDLAKLTLDSNYTGETTVGNIIHSQELEHFSTTAKTGDKLFHFPKPEKESPTFATEPETVSVPPKN